MVPQPPTRKPSFSEEKLQAIQQALREGMSKAAVCRNFAIKRPTLIDALNRTPPI
jgi:transposase-like protein